MPARVTVGAVLLVRPRRRAEILAEIRGPARSHPSPNAGLCEAAFAAALGVGLGGVARYGGEERALPQLGCGRAPVAMDVEAAIALARDVSNVLAAALAAAGVAAAGVVAAGVVAALGPGWVRRVSPVAGAGERTS